MTVPGYEPAATKQAPAKRATLFVVAIKMTNPIIVVDRQTKVIILYFL